MIFLKGLLMIIAVIALSTLIGRTAYDHSGFISYVSGFATIIALLLAIAFVVLVYRYVWVIGYSVTLLIRNGRDD